jgi:hypothetical protein
MGRDMDRRIEQIQLGQCHQFLVMLEGTESLELGAKVEIVPKYWQVASRTAQGWMF